MAETPPIILVTGIQAAGKSTVAQGLAEHFSPSVHVRGDVFRRMVVNGRAEMNDAVASAEAHRQLLLRYQLAATTAKTYAAAGFTVILQDIVLGPDLSRVVEMVDAQSLYVVVLAPRPDVVAAREEERRRRTGKTAYVEGGPTAASLDAVLRAETPRIGLWLDTSTQTPAETVAEILDRVWAEGLV